MITVYSAPLYLAHLLESVLDEHGVRAVVVDPTRAGASDTPNPMAQVMVASEDANIARGIAELFDQHIVRRAATQVDDWSGVSEGDWQEWPRCTRCHARRTTCCPYCKTVGSEFHRGYYPPELMPNRDRELLVCSVCDEAFLPSFLKRCEACGSMFTDGVDSHFPPRSWKRFLRKAIGYALIMAFLIGLWILSQK